MKVPDQQRPDMATSPGAEDPLDRSARAGGRWTLAGQFFAQVFSFCVLVVLYRHVSQDAFGLMAMVLPVVTLFRSFAVLCWQAAVVQWPDLTREDASRFFWGNLATSVLATILTCFLAGWLAWVYSVPQAFSVCVALSGTIVLSGLAMHAQALRERRMEWPRLVAIRLVAQVLAGIVAVVLALRNMQITALVAQQYAEWGALMVLLWWREPWRPKFRCGSGPWFPVLRFNAGFAWASMMFILLQSVDKLLLGWWQGASLAGRAAVGIYAQMYVLTQRPVFLLTGAWGSVLLSALARAGRDPHAAGRIVIPFVRWLALLLWPLAFGGVCVGDELITVLGGSTWQSAGTIVRTLALLTAFHGFVNLAGALFTARQQTVRMAIWASTGVGLIAVAVCGACLLGHARGLDFVAQANLVATFYVVALLAWAIPYLGVAGRLVPVSRFELRRALAAPLISSLVMVAAVCVLRVWLQTQTDLPAVARLFAYLLVGGSIYAALLWAAFYGTARSGR